MINGEEPKNETEAKIKKQVEEIKTKGRIIDLPGEW